MTRRNHLFLFLKKRKERTSWMVLQNRNAKKWLHHHHQRHLLVCDQRKIWISRLSTSYSRIKQLNSNMELDSIKSFHHQHCENGQLNTSWGGTRWSGIKGNTWYWWYVQLPYFVELLVQLNREGNNRQRSKDVNEKLYEKSNEQCNLYLPEAVRNQ